MSPNILDLLADRILTISGIGNRDPYIVECGQMVSDLILDTMEDIESIDGYSYIDSGYTNDEANYISVAYCGVKMIFIQNNKHPFMLNIYKEKINEQ